MEIAEMNVTGNRGLIAAIITKAIEDGRIYKRPRPPQISTKSYRKYNKKAKIIMEYIKNLFLLKVKSQFVLAVKINIIERILKTLKRIKNSLRSYSDELLAYEARCFLDSSNQMFNFYCTLIDINPEYLAQKIQKYYYNWDNGIKK
jgi:hypothetical protein